MGRPNVGKSTLFNRMTRTKRAMVDDTPGVTRDRLYGRCFWNDREFYVVDTGGFSHNDPDAFVELIHQQVRAAVEEADVVVMVLDARAGLSPFDQDMLDLLRPLDKPVFHVVNKIDNPDEEDLVNEFYTLGLEPLYPVSAEHGYGYNSFMNQLVRAFPRQQTLPPRQEVPHIAVVGRPNVGKSSLINQIVGSERCIVSEAPGTTRDAVDTPCVVDGKGYVLVDTAGIRRKSRVSEKLERFSVIRALRSLSRCDVALIMVDASQGLAEQDVRIAGHAQERGCGCIWVYNKWDLVDTSATSPREQELDLRHDARFLSYAPFVTVSAKTGKRVQRLFPLIDEVYEQYCTRVPTGPLNRIVEDAVQRHEPPLHRGRRLKFYYATQVSTKPPTFVLFVSYPDAVHFSYRRFLTNHIRMETGLDKVPIRVYFRERDRREINFGNKKGKRK